MAGGAGGELRLTRAQARRIAVRAQLLDLPRPTDVLAVVRHLGFLQHDQTRAVAPNADLVLWSRLGATYDPAELGEAVDAQALVELQGMLRPAEDLALYRAEMAAWPGAAEGWQREAAQWLADNDGCRRDVLELLRTDGPMPARDLPDTCVRPWRSSGWNNGKNVERMLVLLVERGEVAVHGREGRERLWDLADRVYPDEPAVPLPEALRRRAERRLSALGLARQRAAVSPGEPNDVGPVGEPVRVEGLRGTWRADPAQLARADEPWAGRTALLSPLDRLVFDRKRMTELFDFDYQLEMYKPAEQRRWGYWALPVLAGDRLVGKVDATADPEAGELLVHAVHEDEPFDAALAGEVGAELASLADWLGLALVRE
ncbi:winged helix-turn-helix domain-containing protein [Nocardioides sp. zg-579]|uniref:Winged helix-turn-helix domain-containing protein n=1 Tax=Nocardioides marmotae TaxID=2663857 RepID=A0A6I3JB35_9ACTN|nr:crosslink repair DNA glycosylase YcaQ family protein [Nocardioides marmotae]MCR6031689.1 winged helix-turn-helix domain-containing protein [Gordonia jinghuaiqii]MTB95328.1 winged helix-turn-helix domain-containing protein [Nocardioides marmotae]QKE02211.1 winged helix-turn-helix domain-containing protein [Nocardioides marmotae]